MKLKAGVHMNVSRDRLSVIGKLIGIYREERRGNTQNSFTLKKFCEGICSINTLKNIEAGGLSRSEDVYIELLGKLDLKFGEFPVIDEALITLTFDIYTAIEYYDRDRISTYINKFLKLLNEVDDYVYYSDLKGIVERLRYYYLDDKHINERELNHYTKILAVFPNHFKDMLKIILFTKLQQSCSNNISEYKRLISILNINESNNVCIKMMMLHYYFVTGEYLSMNRLVNELEEVFKLNKNYARLIDTYNYGLLLCSYADNSELDVYVKKIDELISSCRLPIIKIGEVFANIAATYHYNEEYYQAIKYYEKMFEIIDGDYLPKLILIADCQNRLGIDIKLKRLTKSQLETYSIEYRKMYKYFMLPSDIPDFVKENYIIKELVPILKDDVFIKIFRFELNKLIDKTGHYKSLYLFDKYLSLS